MWNKKRIVIGFYEAEERKKKKAEEKSKEEIKNEINERKDMKKRCKVRKKERKKGKEKKERKRYLNHPQFWSKDPTPTNPWDGKSLIAFTLWLIMAVTTCLTANKQFWTSSVPPIIATGALYVI